MAGVNGSNARLIGLNVALLGVLGALTVIGATHAGAQPGTQAPTGNPAPGEATLLDRTGAER